MSNVCVASLVSGFPQDFPACGGQRITPASHRGIEHKDSCHLTYQCPTRSTLLFNDPVFCLTLFLIVSIFVILWIVRRAVLAASNRLNYDVKFKFPAEATLAPDWECLF